MTKLVPLRTIEHGLRRALSILEIEGAQRAIHDLLGVRRSASLFRKCADPDDDKHHLQFRYAVALDVGCAMAEQQPPFLEVHHYLVEQHGRKDPPGDGDGAARLVQAVLALQAALGDLSQTVSEGLRADGPGGTRLTIHEKHAIYETLEAIDHQTEMTKRTIAE